MIVNRDRAGSPIATASEDRARLNASHPSATDDRPLKRKVDCWDGRVRLAQADIDREGAVLLPQV
jgi:hypothetical protein